MKIEEIKLGVVGLGSLGRHHLRIFSEILKEGKIYICDVSNEVLNKYKKEYKVDGVPDYRELKDKVNCVSIVAPTEKHFEIGKFFLENGVHTFIEKPITNNLDDAKSLFNISIDKNIILQIGHIERFNPAVIYAKKYITNPRFIEALRLSPYDERVGATDVILDLMIHDIDIILSLINDKIATIDAMGTKVFSEQTDIVNTRLKFSSGCVANISSSRISLEKFRKIRIFQDDSYISLDYMKQELKVVRKKGEKVHSMKDLEVLHPRLRSEEPLKLELFDFIKCITENRNPEVTAKEGIGALEVALQIKELLNLK